MATTNNDSIQNRYDIVYLFDITDGNPNGDPDAGNLPRIDPETGQGLVTDVCLKRKIRNYVGLVHKEQPPYEIYVKERAVLNRQHERAYKSLDLKHEKRKMPKDEGKARELTAWMCSNFYDIRTFGAVMSTDVNCGQVRGAVQFGFARSMDPIVSLEHAITVCAARKADKPIDEQIGIQGRKFTVSYGLYRVYAYVNPNLAEQTGFSTADLDLFKQALAQMFEHDRSAARANMRPCRCIAFKHDSKLGNARADQLFARVKIELKPELAKQKRPARSFNDYSLRVDEGDLPSGVTVEYWV